MFFHVLLGKRMTPDKFLRSEYAVLGGFEIITLSSNCFINYLALPNAPYIR